ncbi:MAG: 23S rRNA (pseudouridine(1915)-N(3))-methyltransferase RlmH [Clostridia bacterium]
MKLKIIAVGKLKEEYWRDTVKLLTAELLKKNSLEIIEVEDEAIPENAGGLLIIKAVNIEGERLRRYIAEDEIVWSLCIDGEKPSTEKWRNKFQKYAEEGRDKHCFIIGGSCGLSKRIMNNSDEKLSFSSMTFPHQLMRVVLLEQLMQITM